MSRLLFGLIIIAQTIFSLAQHSGWVNQQVPVCVPAAGNPLQGSGCSGLTFHFPRSEHVRDFVQYHGYVPGTNSMTMCSWLESTIFHSFATVASYAVRGQSNEMFVAFLNPDILRFVISGTVLDIPIASLREVPKIHLCVWFSSRLGQAGYYINGEQQDTRPISFSTKIRGGGTLILGQEQDSLGGSFDGNQSFRGNITNLMIWPRVLTRSEITRMIRHCDCPRHFSVEMSLDKVELHGQASYSLLEECPEL